MLLEVQAEASPSSSSGGGSSEGGAAGQQAPSLLECARLVAAGSRGELGRRQCNALGRLVALLQQLRGLVPARDPPALLDAVLDRSGVWERHAATLRKARKKADKYGGPQVRPHQLLRLCWHFWAAAAVGVAEPVPASYLALPCPVLSGSSSGNARPVMSLLLGLIPARCPVLHLEQRSGTGTGRACLQAQLGMKAKPGWMAEDDSWGWVESLCPAGQPGCLVMDMLSR